MNVFVPNRAPGQHLPGQFDPLTAALQPPANETAQEREDRLRQEQVARIRSEEIDETLRQEKKARTKRKEVKVLLLGQSESGKSTTLKQFQLLHNSVSFHAERIAWRSVIYLNIVQSIRRILEAISPEQDYALPKGLSERSDVDSLDAASLALSADGSRSPLFSAPITNYDRYVRKLAPLLSLESRLIERLSSPDDDDEEATHLGTASTSSNPYPQPSAAWTHSPANSSSPALSTAPPLTINTALPRPSPPLTPSPSTPRQELALPSSSNWRKALSFGGKLLTRQKRSDHTGEVRGWWEDPDDPVHVLNACAPAMLELWRDPLVRRRLQVREIRIEENSGFYLDDIERVTAKRYFPSDDDVLRARLKTIGVTEYSFQIKSNMVGHSFNSPLDWKLYDVGGARNQRQAWAPYFEDVNAIIFLAPISAFDQHLTEDPRVNRLEDSFILWKSVVSNKLLQNVNVVLFLNKCDLLQKKLASGVRLSRHMSVYGERPNDYESVSKYFRNKFNAIHQSYSTNKERELYIHLTSVINKQKTQLIIHQVRDIILKANLKYSHLV